jgi:hypothetical protein
MCGSSGKVGVIENMIGREFGAGIINWWRELIIINDAWLIMIDISNII